MIKFTVLSFLIFTPLFCVAPGCAKSDLSVSLPPKREFRAFWITTLDNKDFPSAPSLSTVEQKQEIVDMLDYHQKLGMNVAIFQVRPAADAFYLSYKEPWSEWITGEQGKAPLPFYDPLKFMVEECHKRNMELHAWLNPYRAVFSKEKSNISKNHIVFKRPEWFVEYGNRVQFNPGLPEVRAYLTSIVKDIVERYDLDGIHFDDYFYPYPVQKKEFPDKSTFHKYKGDFSNIHDWRRDNVNQLVKMVYKSIKALKPHVKFGISPAGVWRNQAQDARGSDTNVAHPAYDVLYADALTWLKEGWVDYIAPQLYGSSRHEFAPFNTLSKWWGKQKHKRHIYIGHAFYKVCDNADKAWDSPEELLNQVRLTRQNSKLLGNIFFRAKFLMRNTCHASDSLSYFYKSPALLPGMPWKDSIPPNPPQNLRFIRTSQRVILKWDKPLKAKDGEVYYKYILYRFDKEEDISLDNTSKIISIQKEEGYNEILSESNQQSYVYVVTALDRLQNESKSAKVELK